MILLRTLGTSDLQAPGRTQASAVLAQPKRFALLVYLAVAGRRDFIRRDTLLALFWPEADQSSGRQVLRQTVYLLRRSLGGNAITSRGGEELAVNGDVLTTDVALLEAALAAGDVADALDHYRGDFLAGLHVPDAAPELEEWIARERQRLRALATAGAWSLATADEQRGNAAEAAYWGRRAVDLDPFDEHRVRALMQLLARAGDRAGALRTFQEYTRRLAAQLELEPAEDLHRLAESLRFAPAAAAADAVLATAAAAQDAGSAQVAPATASPRLARPLRRLVWMALAASAAVTAGAMLQRARPAGDPPLVAVGSITDTSSGSASNMPADLLSTSLSRLRGVQVVPISRLYELQSQARGTGLEVTVLDAARRSGARELIEGSLRQDVAGGRVLFELQLVDVNTRRVSDRLRAEGADVFAAADAATRQLARRYGVPLPLESVAGITTSSVVAHRLYEQGLREFYQHNNPSAANRLFRSALGEDSTFAMAAHYAFRTGTDDQPDRLSFADRAMRLASRTADRERLLILSLYNSQLDEPVALAQAETLVARFPAEPDGHLALGVARARAGHFQGALDELARVVAMDSLGLRGNAARCRACDAYGEMAGVYEAADSAAAAEHVLREFVRVQPASGHAQLSLVFFLARQGRHAEAQQAYARVRRLVHGAPEDFPHGEAVLALHADAYGRADSLLDVVTAAGGEAMRGRVSWLRAISLRNQGRMREALDLAQRIRQESMAGAPATSPGNAVMVAQVLLESGRFRAAAALYDTLAAHPPYRPAMRGKVAGHRAWYLTHTAAALAAAGDTVRLAALADTIEAIGLGSVFGRDRKLHHHVRGLLLRARGDPLAAETEFRRAVFSWSLGHTRTNVELGRLLIEQNRVRDAIPVLQLALQGPLDASNLYVLRTDVHELLAGAFDRIGARDSAAAHYRIVADSWRAADSPYRARGQQARLRANDLMARQ